MQLTEIILNLKLCGYLILIFGMLLGKSGMGSRMLPFRQVQDSSSKVE